MFKRILGSAALVSCLPALSISSAASAAETITYTYDARGRLVEVNHTTGPSAGVKTEYEHDDAHNVKRKRITGA